MKTPSHIDDRQAAEGGQAAQAPDAAAAAPRLVIRGESSQEQTVSDGGERSILIRRGRRSDLIAIPLPRSSAHPLAALTDYLNLTFPFSASSESISVFLSQVTASIGHGFGGLEERGKGLHGCRRSFAFEHGRVLLAFGGQRGTAFLSIPGEGCALIPDWDRARLFFESVLGGRITRWDGAVDDYEGSHSVDQAVESYRAGGFNAGGNKPSCSQHGNWIEPDGRGRTFYVGRRDNGKLMRIYEKGKQLGDPTSPWVRWELELHNVSREIPFDVLSAPGQYVAGAYPCTAWVQEQASRIRTIRKSEGIGYAYLVHAAQTSYGRLVNVMLPREGSAEAVIARLQREGTPKRLQFSHAFLQGRESDDEI